jgi:hypothetical protein
MRSKDNWLKFAVVFLSVTLVVLLVIFINMQSYKTIVVVIPTTTPTPVQTETIIPSSEPTITATATMLPTPNTTLNQTPVPTATPAQTATPVQTVTPVPTATPIPTATPTPVSTATPSPTATPEPVVTPTYTPIPTVVPTETHIPINILMTPFEKFVFEVNKTLSGNDVIPSFDASIRGGDLLSYVSTDGIDRLALFEYLSGIFSNNFARVIDFQQTEDTPINSLKYALNSCIDEDTGRPKYSYDEQRTEFMKKIFDQLPSKEIDHANTLMFNFLLNNTVRDEASGSRVLLLTK